MKLSVVAFTDHVHEHPRHRVYVEVATHYDRRGGVVHHVSYRLYLIKVIVHQTCVTLPRRQVLFVEISFVQSLTLYLDLLWLEDVSTRPCVVRVHAVAHATLPVL